MDDLDVVILTGPPATQAGMDKIGLAASTPPVNGIKLPCQRCKQDTWVGERQQQMLRTNSKAVVLCFLCTAKLQVNSKPTDRYYLGNLGGRGGEYTMKDGTNYPEKRN